MKMINTFYLVWNELNGTPTYKHKTLLSAEKEAKRLAKNNPGEKFHVLTSNSTFEMPDPVIKTEHTTDDMAV